MRSIAVRASTTAAYICLLLALTAVSATANCVKTSLADIEDEVMCPVCGTSLAIATEAPQAKRERAFIREQIKQCKSKTQIKQALVTQFGSEVLATPERSGFDLSAWLVPALAILLAALGIAITLIRWRVRRRPRGQATEPRSQEVLTAEDEKRLEDELRRLDP